MPNEDHTDHEALRTRPEWVQRAVVAALVVAALNAVVWVGLNRPREEVSFTDRIRAFSYSPYRQGASPMANEPPRPEVISADMAQLVGVANEVRTYTCIDGHEKVVDAAAAAGLTVTAGAWIGPESERNERELAGAIDVADAGNVRRLIVGNEALLRRDVTVEQMIAYLDRARAATRKPVSTAEAWHTWLEHPELAAHADFIAVHILPYWEGQDVDVALGFTREKLRLVQTRFPGKPVVITEIGWPSDGRTFRDAVPGPSEQARFLRRFLDFARAEHIDYTLMEAYDQPWKLSLEGSVGPYWGLFDAEGREKFSLVAPIVPWRTWPLGLAASILLALPLFVFVLRRTAHWRLGGQLVAAALVQSIATHLVFSAHAVATTYVTTVGLISTLFLIGLQILLLGNTLAEGYQFADLFFAARRRRPFGPVHSRPGSPLEFAPKVSIHVAICREPPHLVIETLESLAALDYPNFEVLVIDNNTPDAALWEPVAERCRTLGPRFRFFHLEKWPGYKAGALNFALRETAPDAEIVGVVDADYVLSPDWLRGLVPHFARPQVAFVQAPQDHRGCEDSLFKTWCNWEYAGFFNLGMVHRNDDDAIIQHGTMTLVRKSALTGLSGWSEWCICEDAELGLRLFAKGLESVYVPKTFGRGLTPDSFVAFKKQRFRWAYGAMQILKRHAGAVFLGRDTALSRAQRYHFAVGWLPWLCDGLAVLVVGASLVWTAGFFLWPQYFASPLSRFVAPVLTLLFLKVIWSWLLYARHVPCNFKERVGASLAALSLSHSIGKATLYGLFTSKLPFLRTPKCENKPALMQGVMMAGEELTLALLLWAGSIAVWHAGADLPDVRLWAWLLFAQSLPYLAAVITSFVNVTDGIGRRPLPQPVPVLDTELPPNGEAWPQAPTPAFQRGMAAGE